jgi:tryptophan synthase, alpha subunit
MTNLISQTFKNNEKKLVTFVTGGDPNFNTSLEIIKTIINNGVDIIEIGMPFSDPMADGPTIQLSSNRAISEGIDLENIFSLAAESKKIKNDLPVILMGYYNLILYFGIEKFVKKCVENGVDGLIIVDLQPEEDEDLINELRNNQIDLIRLITPTTDEERLKLILNNASGFLYYVSVMGITGQKSADLNDLEKSVAFIKKHTNLPVVPGFGIKNSKDVSNICKIADGAVVGSSIIKIIEENLTNKEKMLSEIDKFSKDLKNGTRI